MEWFFLSSFLHGLHPLTLISDPNLFFSTSWWDNFQNTCRPFYGALFVSKLFFVSCIITFYCILHLSVIFYFAIICYCFSLHFHWKNYWLNFNSVTCVHYPVGCKIMYTSSVGIIITLSVVRTILSVVNIYPDGCMHIHISCTYYSISCKHFAKFMSVTPSVVGTSYCISCTHYSSCTHCSVGCMLYSVSCVHYSVKLWKVWTQESFHCGQQKEPATYSWSAALF